VVRQVFDNSVVGQVPIIAPVSSHGHYSVFVYGVGAASAGSVGLTVKGRGVIIFDGVIPIREHQRLAVNIAVGKCRQFAVSNKSAL
jgi:hypothetical protein